MCGTQPSNSVYFIIQLEIENKINQSAYRHLLFKIGIFVKFQKVINV